MRTTHPDWLPGYFSIYGEVVMVDVYGLQQLDFQPDVVLDLGANVGVFTRYARQRFPNAMIVAVEPDADNFANLCTFTPAVGMGRHALLNAAIGMGQVWETVNTTDKDNGVGAHGCFLSPGLGYPVDALTVEGAAGVTMRPSDLPVLRLADLFELYVRPGDSVLVKMDIEGNEHTVFTDEPSMQLLRGCDYVAIEIHRYAIDGSLIAEVKAKTDAALGTFEPTHDVHWEHVVFRARKRALACTPTDNS